MKEFSKYMIYRIATLRIVHIAILYAIVFLMPVAYAGNGIQQNSIQNYSTTLDNIERNLKRHSYNEDKIPEATKQVAEIKLAATQCISTETANSEKLKSDLNSLGAQSNNEPADARQKRAELNNEIIKSENMVSSCRVFLLRSEELLNTLSAEQQKLVSARLLAKGPDVRHLILKNWNKPSLWIDSIQVFLLNDTGVKLLSAPDQITLFFIFAIMLTFSLIVRKRLYKHMERKNKLETFSQQFSRSVLAVTSYYFPHLCLSISFAIFIYTLTFNITPVPFVSVVAYGLPIYFSLVATIEIFLNPRKPAVSFHALPDGVAEALAQRLKVFVLLLFVGYLFFTTLLTQSFPEETLLLSRGVLVVVFFINLIWAVRLFGKIPRFADTFAIRLGVNTILTSIMLAELLGYRNLSDYIVLAVFGTLFSVGIFILVSRLMNELFDGIAKGKRTWQLYIRESLGVKSRKKLPELTWIRFMLTAGLWFFLLVSILKTWGLSEAGFQELKLVFMDGFTVGTFKIIPSRILFAIITLVLLLAFNRWFRSQLERNWLPRTNMDRGAREAVATMSSYLGVAIALIISLSFTGVEFGNLAIIAGALSVGIGFGLQNIVNNFVSGLILLFERPIKTGDWIVVGNTEGYVKRISIRSTQIQTFDRADVIVPNSDLISGQVTNWMLRDVRGRIRIPIGVAYGSDINLVQNLLLEVAEMNPSVIVDGSVPEPKVLFLSFGDSALLFELRVFIKNIDQRFQVTSDMNFLIEEVFRNNNIQIPFPQRDIHIISDAKNKPQEK